MDIKKVNYALAVIEKGISDPELLFKRMDPDVLELSRILQIDGREVKDYIVDHLNAKFGMLGLEFNNYGKTIEVNQITPPEYLSLFDRKDHILDIDLAKKTYEVRNSCIRWYEDNLEQTFLCEPFELRDPYNILNDFTIRNRMQFLRGLWNQNQAINARAIIADTIYVVFHKKDLMQDLNWMKREIEIHNKFTEQRKNLEAATKSCIPNQISKIKESQSAVSEYLKTLNYTEV